MIKHAKYIKNKNIICTGDNGDDGETVNIILAYNYVMLKTSLVNVVQGSIPSLDRSATQ